MVLAILQNQWFRDPDRVREILARTPQVRPRLIAYALFAGCRTGRVLKRVFGEDLCRRITWEEASPHIGGQASAVFPADLDHLTTLVMRHQPVAILAFGKIAADAMAVVLERPTKRLITGPHPAARQPQTESRLIQMKIRLKEMVV